MVFEAWESQREDACCHFGKIYYETTLPMQNTNSHPRSSKARKTSEKKIFLCAGKAFPASTVLPNPHDSHQNCGHYCTAQLQTPRRTREEIGIQQEDPSARSTSAYIIYLQTASSVPLPKTAFEDGLSQRQHVPPMIHNTAHPMDVRRGRAFSRNTHYRLPHFEQQYNLLRLLL